MDPGGNRFAVTWKYPSRDPQRRQLHREFYSIALTNNYQQADTGTKMVHLGRNTKSTIISKGISPVNPKQLSWFGSSTP